LIVEKMLVLVGLDVFAEAEEVAVGSLRTDSFLKGGKPLLTMQTFSL
jgi:hypothetical protein